MLYLWLVWPIGPVKKLPKKIINFDFLQEIILPIAWVDTGG